MIVNRWKGIPIVRFIETGQYNDNLYDTSVEAVKLVASHKHCILDVNALAINIIKIIIKKLISSNMLPIIVLIKPPSVKFLRNLSKNIRLHKQSKIKCCTSSKCMVEENYEYVVKPGEMMKSRYSIEHLIGTGSFGQSCLKLKMSKNK